MHRKSCNVMTIEEHVACVGSDLTGQLTQERRFPGSIGSEDGVDFPLANIEVDICSRNQTAIGLSKVSH